MGESHTRVKRTNETKKVSILGKQKDAEMNKDLSKMVKLDNLVPIILGVALSGLSTLMSFAYDEMEQLNSELVEHRLLLSRLISPDGGIIQSPTSAKAKADVIQTLNKMQQDIKVLETKMSYVEKKK